MVNIHNDEVTRRLVEDTKLSISEGIPNQLSQTIAPVLIVNPRITSNVLKQLNNIATGNLTIFRTPIDKDFYLTSAFIAYSKDGSCNNTELRLVVVLPDGSTNDLLSIPSITLIANESNLSQSFNPPVKLQRDSEITLVGSFSLGLYAKSGGITGYSVDTLIKN